MRFDMIEMDTIRPMVTATHQDDGRHWLFSQTLVCTEQLLALGRAHRAVVKIEMQEADVFDDFATNFLNRRFI